MARRIRSMKVPARAAAAVRDLAATARKAIEARVVEARSKTLGTVTHLEKVFEQRVARAMGRLGVPSARDVRALSRQVAQLQASVERLKRARARA
jgi:poly(hydroxyalkanoate) granule-associated protein